MGQLPFTPCAKKVLEFAIDEARALDHNYVGTEHLLLGLLREQEVLAAQVLMNLGLKLEDVRNEVMEFLGAETQQNKDSEPQGSGESSSSGSSSSGSTSTKSGESKTPALDSFGRDLTELARDGKLDPASGR